MIENLKPTSFWKKGAEWFTKKKVDVEKRFKPDPAA